MTWLFRVFLLLFFILLVTARRYRETKTFVFKIQRRKTSTVLSNFRRDILFRDIFLQTPRALRSSFKTSFALAYTGGLAGNELCTSRSMSQQHCTNRHSWLMSRAFSAPVMAVFLLADAFFQFHFHSHPRFLEITETVIVPIGTTFVFYFRVPACSVCLLSVIWFVFSLLCNKCYLVFWSTIL